MPWLLSLLLSGFIENGLIVLINPLAIKQVVFFYFIAVNRTVRINNFFQTKKPIPDFFKDPAVRFMVSFTKK